MNRNVKRIIVVAAVSLATCLLILAWLAGKSVFRTHKGTPTLALLESRTGIHFPQGTRLINGYYEGWQDYEYFGLLEFDAKYADAFLKSIPRRDDQFRTTVLSRKDRFGMANNRLPLHGIRNPGWWNPDSVKRFVAVKVDGTTNVYLLVSMDDPVKTKIYLSAFTS